MNPIKRYFELPTLIGMGMVFQYALFTSIAIFYAYLSLPNPLIDSNNGVFHGSYVHAISWTFVFVFAIYIRIKLPIYSTKMNRYPRSSRVWPYAAFIYNTLLVILLTGFLLALSEFTWEVSVTYWWYVTGQMTGITLNNFVLTYGFVLTISVLCANIGLRNYRYFRHAWLIPLYLLILNVIWVELGMPMSTRPNMLYDNTANIIEVIGHWGITSALFVMLFSIPKSSPSENNVVLFKQ